MRQAVLAFVLFAFSGACTEKVVVGGDPAQQPKLVDTNGDGLSDAIDFDGDGQPDLFLPFSVQCQQNPFHDTNMDGHYDSLDMNCDGTPDFFWCDYALIDDNGDGKADMVDLDCDGMGDVPTIY